MNKKEFLKLIEELERQAPKSRIIPQTHFEKIDLVKEIEKLKEEYDFNKIIVNPWTFEKLKEMRLLS